MAKKPNVAHNNSIVAYNHQLRDIKNKKIKLERHVKHNPNDKINIEQIMTDYMKNRKKSMKITSTKAKVRRKSGGNKLASSGKK